MAVEIFGSLCCIGFFLIILAAILSILSLASRKGKKELKPSITQFLIGSGIIRPEEPVIHSVDYAAVKIFRNVPRNDLCGILVLTDKRLLLVQRPSQNSSGLVLMFYALLRDMMSITAVGSGKLEIMINTSGVLEKIVIELKNAELFCKKTVEAKGSIVEKEPIVAKTVIIEEQKKDDAVEILKKRLARGEITKEEFHDKVQRL